MKKTDTISMDTKKTNRDWKNKNKKYLQELESFLDKAENIDNEELRKEIIFQMLKCDEKLTIIAENTFIKYYQKGYEDYKGD